MTDERRHEWRVVDGDGTPIDMGLDVGWIIHETREQAEEDLRGWREDHERYEDEDAEHAHLQVREVLPWEDEPVAAGKGRR